jgi:hypothetical protein
MLQLSIKSIWLTSSYCARGLADLDESYSKVYSCRLKVRSDTAAVTCGGKLFQTRAPATGNESRVNGTSRLSVDVIIIIIKNERQNDMNRKTSRSLSVSRISRKVYPVQ